jgi:CubicO group peptidase (beta-lactamase class C family)
MRLKQSPIRPLIWGFMGLYIVLCSQCTALRSVSHLGQPHERDHRAFPERFIFPGTEKFRFAAPANDPHLGTAIKIDTRKIPQTQINLKSFLETHKTLAFLIIRNDTLLYEYYHNRRTQTTPFPSFSVSKAFLTTLTGVAIREKYISSYRDSITRYLPALRGKGLEKVCIEHLLNHTSGLGFHRRNDLIEDNVRLYWRGKLRERTTRLYARKPAGSEYKYQNINTVLMAMIIESATGHPMSHYLEHKIWKPLGMEYSATWSLDEKERDGTSVEKAFCCLNARARDFAKLGRLYLHKGEWNGQTIFSADWFQQTIFSDSGGNGRRAYHYSWGRGPEAYGSYYAQGLYGQIIYVYPRQNMVIVRLGQTDKKYHPSFWHESILQVIDQMGAR